MLRTMLNLECEGCGAAYPRVGNSPAPVDGAIYTVAMLREEAKGAGWVRRMIFTAMRDLCPRCSKKNSATKQAAR
jgi:hypothetical protein